MVLAQGKGYRILANGDAAITVIFAQEIGEPLTRRILALVEQLKLRFADQLTNRIPSYQALTICFQPLSIDLNQLLSAIKVCLDTDNLMADYQGKLINIPVCYQGDFAPDLALVAEHCRLTPDEIIARHTNQQYLVHMLGFLPGFLYLGGMDTALACPRKATPRLKIAPGAVGIAGEQTGVYPIASPGGWQIIGQTPLKLFDVTADSPFIAKPLDKIQFTSISIDEFHRLAGASS